VGFKNNYRNITQILDFNSSIAEKAIVKAL
jgi:hypothetical protein